MINKQNDMSGELKKKSEFHMGIAPTTFETSLML